MVSRCTCVLIRQSFRLPILTRAPGVQVAPGDFLSADFVVQNRADNQAGTIDFAVTQLNPSKTKSGSGTLFTVYFQGIAADKTSPAEATMGRSRPAMPCPLRSVSPALRSRSSVRWLPEAARLRRQPPSSR